MRSVVLRQSPDGLPEPSDFEVREGAVPEPGPGQVLVETEWLSLDPYQRAQMAGRHLSGTAGAGEVLKGETVGVVTASNATLAVGARVRGMGGWTTHAVLDADAVRPVSDRIPEPRWALSVMGMPGLTAWAALRIAGLKADETVVIPAATGPVGSVAAGLARQRGARVVGVVGTDEKVRYATDALGLDAAINRRTEDVGDRLAALCPDGIDVYLDLVGGSTAQAAVARLALGARVILIGLMADYNRPQGTPPTALDPGALIRARASATGFVVYDHEPQREAFLREVAPLVASGAVPFKEEVVAGLDAAPAAFARLMRGETFGKVVVRVRDADFGMRNDSGMQNADLGTRNG